MSGDDGTLTGRLGRAALRPARAAARSGKTALADEAERAIDAVLAGPLPEAVVRSIARHSVVRRAVREALETMAQRGPAANGEPDEIERAVRHALQSPLVERYVTDVIDSRMLEEVAGRVVESAAFDRVLRGVLSSPELRQALREQTRGFGAETAASARQRAGELDDAAEAKVRRGGRPARTGAFAGLVTRGIALVVDAALVQVLFLVAAGSVALVASLAADITPGVLAGSLAGAGWLAIVGLYFVGFWSGAGRTPGMHLMQLQVRTGSGAPPGIGRSIVRLVGLVLAIIPLGAGFLPVLFDSRRRALQDYLAGTVVVHDGVEQRLGR